MPLHKDYSNLSDEQLCGLLRQGEDGAFDCLYLRYRNKLIHVATNRTQSRTVAEELVQEVFADLWQRRTTITITRTFSAYALTAMKYAVLDHIRSLKRKKTYLQQITAFEDRVTDATREQVEHDELDYHLNTRINALPDKCREVFKLSRFENHTVQEIADKLNISPDTAKYHISHALKELRISLKDFYLVLSILLLK